jgi:hypothetical protein
MISKHPGEYEWQYIEILSGFPRQLHDGTIYCRSRLRFQLLRDVILGILQARWFLPLPRKKHLRMELCSLAACYTATIGAAL